MDNTAGPSTESSAPALRRSARNVRNEEPPPSTQRATVPTVSQHRGSTRVAPEPGPSRPARTRGSRGRRGARSTRGSTHSTRQGGDGQGLDSGSGTTHHVSSILWARKRLVQCKPAILLGLEELENIPFHVSRALREFHPTTTTSRTLIPAHLKVC
ncbi:hypothetical protein EV426DRAFT_601097 [Tirmania nivea]|nr:hypothetical protein EV426DRAFT_601097 [Tirmania nivea]